MLEQAEERGEARGQVFEEFVVKKAAKPSFLGANGGGVQ